MKMEEAAARIHNAQAALLRHCSAELVQLTQGSAISWQYDGKSQLGRLMNGMGLEKDKKRPVLLEFPARSVAACSKQIK